MNAINHAASALIIKKHWPDAPLIPTLISVQFIEILWVIFNVTGLEWTRFDDPVYSLANIHLVHMPFSHSIAFSLMFAAIAWAFCRYLLHKPGWAIPLTVGVLSHIVLDIATHAPDVEIVPFLGLPEIGTGLYLVPVLALLVELMFAAFCCWYYGGDRFMLVALVILNLLGASIYIPSIAGAEVLISDYPGFFAPVIGVHIVVGWFALGYLIRRHERLSGNGG